MAYVCFGDQTLNVVSKTPKIEFRNSHVLPSLPNPVFCDALLANPKAVLGSVPPGQTSQSRRAGSRFTLVRLPPTQASHTPTWNQTMKRLLQAGMVWNSLSPGPILSESKLKQSMVIVWIQLRESIRNHENLLKLETWNKNWNHCTC